MLVARAFMPWVRFSQAHRRGATVARTRFTDFAPYSNTPARPRSRSRLAGLDRFCYSRIMRPPIRQLLVLLAVVPAAFFQLQCTPKNENATAAKKVNPAAAAAYASGF